MQVCPAVYGNQPKQDRLALGAAMQPGDSILMVVQRRDLTWGVKATEPDVPQGLTSRSSLGRCSRKAVSSKRGIRYGIMIDDAGTICICTGLDRRAYNFAGQNQRLLGWCLASDHYLHPPIGEGGNLASPRTRVGNG